MRPLPLAHCRVPSRFYLAARHLETAGHCARESSSASGEEVGALFRRAAALYVQAARPQAAAEALSHGGKAVEALDAGLAVELYLEARFGPSVCSPFV